MKEISINGRVLQYEVKYYSDDLRSSVWIEFYEGEEDYKPFSLFRKLPTIKRPKCIFQIKEDANDPRLSKKWWRERILLELELMGRQEELNKGELI